MVTYLILNLVFLVLVAGGIFAFRVRVHTRAAVTTLGILLLLTALFDSLIIVSNIVAYDTTKILGVYVGRAPIEDFFYALLAGIAIPGIWHLHKRKEQK